MNWNSILSSASVQNDLAAGKNVVIVPLTELGLSAHTQIIRVEHFPKIQTIVHAPTQVFPISDPSRQQIQVINPVVITPASHVVQVPSLATIHSNSSTTSSASGATLSPAHQAIPHTFHETTEETFARGTVANVLVNAGSSACDASPRDDTLRGALLVPKKEHHMSSSQINSRNESPNSNKGKYKCSECAKSYSRKKDLKRHSRVHDPSIPGCPHCGKKFGRQSYLEDHIRTHTGEKPFQCEICEKKFACKRNLNQHSRIHNNEKPYPCPLCNKKFKVKQSLKNHLKNLHQS